MGLFNNSNSPGNRERRPPAADEPAGADIDDTDEVDDGNKNIILSIIAQLRPGSDLSRITLPTFILERKSMLERITNQMQHPELIIEAQRTDDPVDRFVQVVRWYMSSWHIAPKAVKKPLNPVLGEYFTCYWPLPDGTYAYYLAEQTSHHPPKSAYFYAIPAHDIQVDGLLLPRSRFLGNSAASMMDGVGYVNFLDRNEVYEITQPNVYARGILVGNLKYEMGDHAIVECPALDMKVDIEFKVKGFISGQYHSIAGKIERHGKPLFELSGKWNECMYIKDLRSGSTKEFFDTANDKPFKPQVRPIKGQGTYESRRLWQQVTDALAQRNHEVATNEKAKIEDEQRLLAKRRQETGETWVPKLFEPTPEGHLQYRLFAHDALAAAKTPEEKERIIRSIAGIRPEDPTPANFNEPWDVKKQSLQNAARAHGASSGAHTGAGAPVGAPAGTGAPNAGVAAGAAGVGAVAGAGAGAAAGAIHHGGAGVSATQTGASTGSNADIAAQRAGVKGNNAQVDDEGDIFVDAKSSM